MGHLRPLYVARMICKAAAAPSLCWAALSGLSCRAEAAKAACRRAQAPRWFGIHPAAAGRHAPLPTSHTGAWWRGLGNPLLADLTKKKIKTACSEENQTLNYLIASPQYYPFFTYFSPRTCPPTRTEDPPAGSRACP